MQLVPYSLFRVSQVSRTLRIIGSSASQIQIKFGTGISRVRFSESPILPNIVGTSFQFRATCSFDVRRFYSTKNSIQNLDRSRLGSVSFIKIAGSPYFVDKTLFIQKVLECGSEHMLITAPRRFGKSVNLHMLRCFFENRDHYDLFSRLKIGHTPAMDYCGEFPVIWLNFKVVGVITSEEDAVAACRQITNQAFWQHKILVTSPKLTESQKNYCKTWCDDIQYKSFDKNDVLAGIRKLAQYLYSHYGKRSMLLVDEYDAICTAAFSKVDARVLDDIIEFYSSMLGNVIKSNADFVERAILTGITRIMSSGLSGPINNVIDYPFSEKSNFSEFYGITELEFDELMNRECAATLRHLKEEAFNYYNGYVWNNQRLLNMWSVMNFLEHKELKPYWVQSGIVELRPENTCRNEIVRNCVMSLTKGENLNIEVEPFNAKNFKSFYENFNQLEDKKLINPSPLLYFYFQLGYLTMIDTSFDGAFDSMLLKIPNQEIKSIFLKSLITYFENVYCIEKRLVERTVRLLRKLDINDENGCQQILTSVRSVLETMCSRGIYQNMLNEATLHELMFTILYISGYEPTSEFIVRAGDGRKYTKYDLCASIHSGQGILIEFEINESSDLALEKIIDKEYFKGLIQRGAANNFLLIGINCNTKSENDNRAISISYIRNTLNLENKVNL